MSPRFEDCQEMTLALIVLEKVNKKTFHKPILKNASHWKFTDGREVGQRQNDFFLVNFKK